MTPALHDSSLFAVSPGPRNQPKHLSSQTHLPFRRRPACCLSLKAFDQPVRNHLRLQLPTSTITYVRPFRRRPACCRSLKAFDQPVRNYLRLQLPTSTITYVRPFRRRPVCCRSLKAFDQPVRNNLRSQLPTSAITYVHNYLHTPFPTAACLPLFTQSI
jgi:hypothetical protein